MALPETRVFSLRIPVVTIAQCYDILEQSGGSIDNLPPSTCIRTVLEALCQQMEGDKHIPSYTDVEAKRRVEALGGQHLPNYMFPTKLPVKEPQPDEAGPHVNAMPHSPEQEEVITDLDERAAARRRLHDILNPTIQEARAAEEAERFRSVRQYDPDLPRVAPVRKPTTVPPWEVGVLASMEELEQAAEVCKMCSALIEDKNELAALAARMVLPNLSDHVLGTKVSQELMQKTYGYVHEYVLSHPDIEPPQCFDVDIEEDNTEPGDVGITIPPETNDVE